MELFGVKKKNKSFYFIVFLVLWAKSTKIWLNGINFLLPFHRADTENAPRHRQWQDFQLIWMRCWVGGHVHLQFDGRNKN